MINNFQNYRIRIKTSSMRGYLSSAVVWLIWRGDRSRGFCLDTKKNAFSKARAALIIDCHVYRKNMASFIREWSSLLRLTLQTEFPGRFPVFTHYLHVSSAGNLCKQFGLRSGLNISPDLDPICLTLWNWFWKKKQQKTRSLKNYPVCKILTQSANLSHVTFV